MLVELWDCVVFFGFYIEFGKIDIDKNMYISMVLFKRNVIFFLVDLVIIVKECLKVFYDVLDKIIVFFVEGVLKLVYFFNKFFID